MRRLVLVRHGESIWNAERRIQGQACAGLSPRGHAQAAATAAALAATYPDATLVVSDLQRTRETVAPLEAALGRAARRDPGLRERSFGSWEGRLRDEVAVSDHQRWQRWLQGEAVIDEVGGESARALGDRVEPVLRGLLEATGDGEVTVAVTHGGPVWQGLHRLLGLPSGTFAGVDNASVHEVVGHGAPGSGIALDRWNDVGHLPLALRSGWADQATDRATDRATAQATGETAATSDAPPVGR